jgi:hypothetical protein
MQAFSVVFGVRIMSSVIWPALSLDLNSCSIFIWACFKDKVYDSTPRKEEVKENIQTEIANIPAELLRRLNQNLFRWCDECLLCRDSVSNTFYYH